LSSYKIRVRAYNAAGWGEYSNISTNATVAWFNNTGNVTPESQTDTDCSSGICSETRNCDCGTQTRTRTSSRSRSRTRSYQYYSRPNSTDQPITYGNWTISDAEWNLGMTSEVGWGAISYGAWSDYGPCSATRTRVTTDINLNGTQYYTITHQDGTVYHFLSGDTCGECYENMYDITLCQGAYRVVDIGCQPFYSIKC
jgi:hypothetical protein